MRFRSQLGGNHPVAAEINRHSFSTMQSDDLFNYYKRAIVLAGLNCAINILFKKILLSLLSNLYMF